MNKLNKAPKVLKDLFEKLDSKINSGVRSTIEEQGEDLLPISLLIEKSQSNVWVKVESLIPSHLRTTLKSPIIDYIAALVTAVLKGLPVVSDSGSALANVATKLGELHTKTSEDGGEYEADEAKLQSKRWEMMEAIADSDIDEAKSNYDEAKEQFKGKSRSKVKSKRS